MELPAHLLNAIETGRACLVLGAGCSLTTGHFIPHRTFQGVPKTDELCREVCRRAGFPYNGEGPRDVFQAVKSPAGPLSDNDLKELFTEAFLECHPAPEINDLFGNYIRV